MSVVALDNWPADLFVDVSSKNSASFFRPKSATQEDGHSHYLIGEDTYKWEMLFSASGCNKDKEFGLTGSSLEGLEITGLNNREIYIFNCRRG